MSDARHEVSFHLPGCRADAGAGLCTCPKIPRLVSDDLATLRSFTKEPERHLEALDRIERYIFNEVVAWRNLKRDYDDVFGQLTRRHGDVHRLEDQLRTEARWTGNDLARLRESRTQLTEARSIIEWAASCSCLEPNEDGVSVCEGECVTCRARALLGGE